MMDRLMVAAFVIVMGVAGGLLIWGVSVLVESEDDRNACVAAHEVCIDTTDGWKPYPGQGQ